MKRPKQRKEKKNRKAINGGDSKPDVGRATEQNPAIRGRRGVFMTLGGCLRKTKGRGRKFPSRAKPHHQTPHHNGKCSKGPL